MRLSFPTSDPLRIVTAHWCGTKGRWCGQFWVRRAGRVWWCDREANAPAKALDRPCPDLEKEESTVLQVVARIARAYGRVMIGDVTAAELLEQWAQNPSRPVGDVFDYAGWYGCCVACDWKCPICGGADTKADCRFDGKCFLAERHVVECVPEDIEWSLPHVYRQVHGHAPPRVVREEVPVTARQEKHRETAAKKRAQVFPVERKEATLHLRGQGARLRAKGGGG